jgi:hypothetical protein
LTFGRSAVHTVHPPHEVGSSTARATRRESSARPKRSIIAPDGAPAAPRGLGDLIRNDTFNNLVALARRESLPRNSASPH